MTAPVGLKCPACGQPPRLVLDGGQQAFCGTDDCPWVMWNPTKTLAELNADATTVDLSPLVGLMKKPEDGGR